MKHTQPTLPYPNDALTPAIGKDTVEFHYGKHEKGYIDNLNRLIVGTEYENMPIEDIIVSAKGAIYNNAAQAWNHIFYFFQFSATPKHYPEGILADRIVREFGSFEHLKSKIEEAGVNLFGSGWVWLSTDRDGRLFITQSHNADNPLIEGLTPILTIDVWEHAYYLDYQNRRADYLKQIWNIIDWEVIEERYEG